MIYILAWLICGVCSFYLLKSFLYRITKDQGGFLHCIHELFRSLDEQEGKDHPSYQQWMLVSDNTILASIHTMYLVISLAIWPIVLAALLYWMYTGATWEELIYEKESVND
jgi:hypothetical protein